jgi:hypothetical protein
MAVFWVLFGVCGVSIAVLTLNSVRLFFTIVLPSLFGRDSDGLDVSDSKKLPLSQFLAGDLQPGMRRWMIRSLVCLFLSVAAMIVLMVLFGTAKDGGGYSFSVARCEAN